MGELFGGGGSEQTSENKAYPWLKDTYGNSSGVAYNQGLGALSRILSGNSAQSKAALDNWWGSSGGDFMMNQGVDAIDAKMSKMGLLNSGAYGKALEGYRSDLASTKLNEILGQYTGLAKLGLGGGQLVGQAGQVSSGSGGGGGGLGQLLGLAMAFI